MDTLQRNVIWPVVSRAAILAVVVILTFLLGRSSQYVWPVTILAFIVFALSLVYALAIKLRIPLGVLIPLQFANDILLVTWLVYRTGDIESPFNALFLVIVFAASMLSSPRGVRAVTLFSLISASLLGLATVYGWVARADGSSYEPTALPELQLNLAYTMAAIVGVAILSSHLADRQRRSETALAVTTRSLADLRAFNERIIESMRSGLITAGLDGSVTICNRAAEEITGFPSSALVGRPLGELFGASVDQYLRDSIAHRAPAVLRSDVEFIKNGGATAQLGFNVAPLMSEDGEVKGVVLIFQDLTEVFELEQEVRRREKLAALGTLAAGLAHEIRNPLTSIRGSVQVLASDIVFDDGSKRLLDIILRESERLHRTLTDFLAYARPAPYSPIEFDLRKGISDALALLKNSPEVNASHVIIDESGPEPLLFVGDPNQMRQVFWNLARNGLQAMVNGGKLTVTLARDPQNMVRLEVRDTGVGMSREQLDNLFDPFASTKKGGTGLGMATVYQFVKEHGGRIQVESEVGAGTTVTLLLPNESTAALRDDAVQSAYTMLEAPSGEHSRIKTTHPK